MSTPPQPPPAQPPRTGPADQPTAPLDPVADPGAPVAYRTDPRYAEARYAEDPRRAAWRLEGLRTALTIVGLIALIAIGLSVWALIRSDHNNHRTVAATPGSAAAMVALSHRVDGLQATVHSLSTAGGGGAGATSGTVRSLSQRVAALETAQKQLSSQVSHAGSGSGNSAQVSQLASKESALSAKVSQLVGKEAQLSGQVSGLQGRVAQLKGQVAQLKSQVSNQTGSSSVQTTTTGTTTGP